MVYRDGFDFLTFAQSFIDPGLQWSDIDWFKSITKSRGFIIPQLNADPFIVSAVDLERRSKMGGRSWLVVSILYRCQLSYVQDAFKAYDFGLAGVVLSNHGGRQLDFSRSGIEVLFEVVTKFKKKRGITFPDARFQLFIDGGVRRATDVLKAVALGATAGSELDCIDGYED